MKRILIGAITVAHFATACVAGAGQPYLVSEFIGGNIWRIEDVNGDGDALDVGEKTMWGDGFAFVGGLETIGRSVFAVESGRGAGSNEVVRLIDLNGDGDALDEGERTVWASGLDLPNDILRLASGSFLVSGFRANEVWRLTDANGDGDALDTTEQIKFADGIANPHGLLPWNDGVLVTAQDSAQVFKLHDLNGDGDALDVFERQVVLSGVTQPFGLLDAGDDRIALTSFTGNSVYLATDRNEDGDFFDVAEVQLYADSVYGSLNSPTYLTPHAAGGFLLSDTADGQVLLVRDLNGDGDALDQGEVVTFADGFNLSVDIVALQEGLPGDYNNDGTVDAADYVVWRNGLGTTYTPADYDVWRANYGQSLGNGSASTSDLLASTPALNSTVPEPATAWMIALVLAMQVLSRRARRANASPAS